MPGDGRLGEVIFSREVEVKFARKTCLVFLTDTIGKTFHAPPLSNISLVELSNLATCTGSSRCDLDQNSNSARHTLALDSQNKLSYGGNRKL